MMDTSMVIIGKAGGKLMSFEVSKYIDIPGVITSYIEKVLVRDLVIHRFTWRSSRKVYNEINDG